MVKRKLRTFIFTGKNHSEIYKTKTMNKAVDAYLENRNQEWLDTLKAGDAVLVEEVIGKLIFEGHIYDTDDQGDKIYHHKMK